MRLCEVGKVFAEHFDTKKRSQTWLTDERLMFSLFANDLPESVGGGSIIAVNILMHVDDMIGSYLCRNTLN